MSEQENPTQDEEFVEPVEDTFEELAEEKPENTLYIHLTLVPFISGVDELKTKPTQHSVMRLREIGIQPHVLLCRCDRPLNNSVKDKIALFCNVRPNAVIEALCTNVVMLVYDCP